MAKRLKRPSRFLIQNGRLRGVVKPSVVVRSTEGNLAVRNVASRSREEAEAAVSKMLGSPSRPSRRV